ncbi:hypothetical protein B0H10DRAFT_1959336 [Mycena sp. CBHHK59/15]|nr:hypothetical protein B0H10DRAFT_1959336 [Mycena sp. CBHHK59/15]
MDVNTKASATAVPERPSACSWDAIGSESLKWNIIQQFDVGDSEQGEQLEQLVKQDLTNYDEMKRNGHRKPSLALPSINSSRSGGFPAGRLKSTGENPKPGLASADLPQPAHSSSGSTESSSANHIFRRSSSNAEACYTRHEYGGKLSFDTGIGHPEKRIAA